MAKFHFCDFSSKALNFFKACQEALQQLQKQPDSLSSLELQYMLHGTESSRKKIQITMDDFLGSEAYVKLSNKVQPDSQENPNSDDLNSILKDFATRIVANRTLICQYTYSIPLSQMDVGDVTAAGEVSMESLIQRIGTLESACACCVNRSLYMILLSRRPILMGLGLGLLWDERFL